MPSRKGKERKNYGNPDITGEGVKDGKLNQRRTMLK